MRRREFMAMLGGMAAFSWAPAAHSQQSPRVARIGVLSPLSQALAARNIEAFRHGLRDLGYVEGLNIAVEQRFADGVVPRLPQLAAELVALKPDAVVVGSSSAIVAAHRATQAIPLIMITLEDPVALGLVKSVARPGTNVTGTWVAGGEGLVGKRLGLLKDIVPGVARVAAFANSGDARNLRLLPAAARSLGLDLRVFEVREAADIEPALAHAARDGAQAAFISSSPLFFSNRHQIVAIAARMRLPAIYGWREFADAGGLMSYGPNLPDVYRRSATLIDKVLKGASPADLPVETPIRFELVVNLKTAKALGLTISESFLLLADEVIE
jgi:putative tryptophan/tyrosine transport system substrate-binding protein